jgi:hypothetical protein
MAGPPTGELSPEDALRLRRWQAAGCPPVPLSSGAQGQVVATSTNLATVLRNRAPAFQPYREAALRWVDAHCGRR